MKDKLILKNNLYAWVIYALMAGFWTVNQYRGGRIALVIYVFCSLIAFPGWFVLLGQQGKTMREDRKALLCRGTGLLLLGFLQKVAVFWVQAITGQEPGFTLYETSGAPWVLLVSGVFLLLTAWSHDWKFREKKLLVLSVLAGLAAGWVSPLEDLFCLSRLVVYLPFYVLGVELDLEQLAERGRKWTYRLFSMGTVGVFALVCLLLRGRWKSFRPLIDGNQWYGDIKGIPNAVVGPVYRLIWYAAAFVLIYAVFCLIPAIRIPVFSEQGKRYQNGYFWYCACAPLFCLPMASKVNLHTAAAAAMLCLLGVLVAPSKVFSRLTEGVLSLPANLLDGRDENRGERIHSDQHWARDMVSLFTVLFAVASVAMVYPFLVQGKSLIWNTDGLTQQYPMMLYCKRYLLECLRQGHLIQWDFTLGFGMTPFDALRREPFMLLSLLGNENTMESIYNLSVVLRLYVFGLTFMGYCWVIDRKDKLSVLMGTLACCFGGFYLYTIVRQPFFITTLSTYFTFMLIGVERYLRKGKFDVFLLSVFLQIINNYYSSYINGLLLAVYLLIRLGCMYGREIGKIVKMILRFIGLYAWGLALGMVTFLPGVLSLMGSAREQTSIGLSLFYDSSFYVDMIANMNLNIERNYWVHISAASICWLACVLLLRRRRKELLPYQIGLAATALLLTFPIFGMISNGFAYVCNRWTFAVPILLGLILVEMVPELISLSKQERNVLTLAAIGYLILVFPLEDWNGPVRLTGFMLLGLTTLTVLALDQLPDRAELRKAVLTALTLATAMISAASFYLPDVGDYANAFVKTDKAYEELAGNVGEALEKLDDDSFFRVGTDHTRINRGMGLGYNGTNSYFSVNPAATSAYFTELAIGDQSQSFALEGMSHRTTPMALANVKYFATWKGEAVPYGFSQMDTLENGGGLYRNDYCLPLGYTYTSYVTSSALEKMTPLQRQEVMLDSAVLDLSTSRLDWNQAGPEQEQIPVTFETKKKASVDEQTKTWKIQSEKDSLKVHFEGKPECESYLVVEGLEFKNQKSKGNVYITSSGTAQKEKIQIKGKGHSYYFDVDGAVFNLGYSEKAQTQCTLTFSNDASLQYQDCYVVCIPKTSFAEKIENLSRCSLENVNAADERITGNIDLQEDRLLVLSVPYAEGWKAKVDGLAAPVYPANIMYCGIMLEPGHHTVELYYQHPGLRAGAMISAAAAAALGVYGVAAMYRRRKSKKKTKEK